MKASGLAAVGLRLSAWFERWFPDAFALAIVAVAIVATASVSIGNSPAQTAQWFGAGFWDLVAFTMQVTMLIISGFAVASAPPVHAVIRRLAGIPKTPQSAAAFVALFSMGSSLVSWTFSLIFSGLLAREVTHRVRGADYRAPRFDLVRVEADALHELAQRQIAVREVVFVVDATADFID